MNVFAWQKNPDNRTILFLLNGHNSGYLLPACEGAPLAAFRPIDK